MIYAQRPDATACAEWDFWNQRMRQYIRRGSKGIALIDTSRGRPVLRYVFDVSDTGCMDDGLNPNLWQYREEHRAKETATLFINCGTMTVHTIYAMSRWKICGGGSIGAAF